MILSATAAAPRLRYVPPICTFSASTSQFRRLSVADGAGKVVTSPPFSQAYSRAPKLPSLPKRNRVRVAAAASKTTSFPHPPMTSKPRWWWRTLACTPYLLPLHLVWLHADSAYHLHPLLQNWDFLVNPFLDTLALMPNWMMMVLVFSAYFLVVRKKEWPHFLRYHVIMAMLLENVCQAIAVACTWLPKWLFRGTLATHFWLALAFVQLYTVVECMRCALNGKYADVPFVSVSAYVHSDPKLF